MSHKHRNDRSRRTLLVERLEDRTVLSGNVVAVQDPFSGLLNITGDGHDNGIAITQEPNGMALVAGELGTTINGEATALFSSLSGISILFLDGNDRVDLLGVNLPGAISITAGLGNNTITLDHSLFQQAAITAGAEIDGAVSNNLVAITNDVVTGNYLNLSLLNESGLRGVRNGGDAGTGLGSVNTVTISNVQFTGAGDLNVTVDDGVAYFDGTNLTPASSLAMTSVATSGNVNVRLGDHFQTVRLGTGTGSVDAIVANNLTLSVGNDVDTVLVSATVQHDESVTVGDSFASMDAPLPAPSLLVNGSVGHDLAITVGSNAAVPTGWPMQVTEIVQGNATIRVGDGVALTVSQSVVGGSLSISMGNGGVNGFESLTLRQVSSMDMAIALASNTGDLVAINLTDVAITDTASVFSFVLTDNGGSGGFDSVSMTNVQVTGNLLVALSSSGANGLFAANVTAAFGYVLGVADYFDGGGNEGWFLVA
jgi:hypothetical protein